MKFKTVLQKVFVGYVTSGMKRNLNSNFKMKKIKIYFIKKIVNLNKFLFIFNLKNICQDILVQIFKNKKLNIVL
jgi:hypothetical protein